LQSLDTESFIQLQKHGAISNPFHDHPSSAA
jgi:hypothetical protein